MQIVVRRTPINAYSVRAASILVLGSVTLVQPNGSAKHVAQQKICAIFVKLITYRGALVADADRMLIVLIAP